jgi:tRNA-splicing ligase RtcB
MTTELQLQSATTDSQFTDSAAYETHHFGMVPVKAWTRGVPVEEAALEQLRKIALLPFIHQWVAVMPDVHLGIDATVGSVIPTIGAVVPSAVGVDIGCGMMAVRTSLEARHLPDSLKNMRRLIERAVPHGRTHAGDSNDRGAFRNLPAAHARAWKALSPGFEKICEKYPKLRAGNTENHLGTLGTGNHFIEMCLDEEQRVWFMLHSGSRGVGNRIGSFFISLAQRDLERQGVRAPDRDLGYFREGSEYYDDYLFAVAWAQDFARENRNLMMESLLRRVRASGELPEFRTDLEAVNCHHNYIALENHYGRDVMVTRKGAVRAGAGELGIIPGSMGARSYIVRGKGNAESFCSCSHGAGRVMSRTQAKKQFSIEDHIKATEGVECRKDEAVIDETPAAYKDIDAVMAAQSDLVEVVHTLKQVLCVKG